MTVQNPSTVRLKRKTKETDIRLALRVRAEGTSEICTGLGMLDHFLDALSRHSRIDLHLEASGDLEIDDHHTVEDCAIVLGRALAEAVGDRRGIERFGWALVPLDEALARVSVDFSGRGAGFIDLGLKRERLGSVATENLTHFLRTLAQEARITLHVDLLRGENDHHRAEAAFKAVALALRQALSPSGRTDVPSTKGTLE